MARFVNVDAVPGGRQIINTDLIRRIVSAGPDGVQIWYDQNQDFVIKGPHAHLIGVLTGDPSLKNTFDAR